MTTKPEGIARLGRAVRDRRIELRMTQDDVARAGGPSDVTVRNLESASVSRVNAGTLGKLDAALQWELGTASSHLQGSVERPVGTAPAPVLLHDASDSALLAEIARRFDLARSSRDANPRPTEEPPPPDRDDLADPALTDGSTTGVIDTNLGRPKSLAADFAYPAPRREDYDRAAMTGTSELDRLDREAAARGEESQDHNGEDPA